jgi:CDP-diglyceride synthetase
LSRQRLLTFVLLIAAGLLTLALPPWSWALAVVAIAARLLAELGALLAAKGSWRLTRLTHVAGLVLVGATAGPALWLTRHGPMAWSEVHDRVMGSQSFALGAAVLLTATWLCWRQAPPAGIADVAVQTFALVYAAWLPSFWALLRIMPNGAWLTFWVAFGVGLSDTVALLVGRWRGGASFFGHLSPNKTRSGALGSLVITPLVQGALGPVCGIPLAHALALGALLAVSAQAGDLVESLLKRDAGVKDAAAVLPGVGGLLDRFDSFLFAGPVAYAYLAWFVVS